MKYAITEEMMIVAQETINDASGKVFEAGHTVGWSDPETLRLIRQLEAFSTIFRIGCEERNEERETVTRTYAADPHPYGFP